jgi:hypothetical protein
VLLFVSGWLRGLIFSGCAPSSPRQFNEMLAYLLGLDIANVWLLSLVSFSTAIVVTFAITWTVSRVVIDFPGYTKALFWGVMRAYEHNLSKAEARILIGMPAFMSIAVFATGYTSLAACLWAAISIAFHSSSYNMKRLKSRTDDLMKARAQVGFATLPDFGDRNGPDRF